MLFIPLRIALQWPAHNPRNGQNDGARAAQHRLVRDALQNRARRCAQPRGTSKSTKQPVPSHWSSTASVYGDADRVVASNDRFPRVFAPGESTAKAGSSFITMGDEFAAMLPPAAAAAA